MSDRADRLRSRRQERDGSSDTDDMTETSDPSEASDAKDTDDGTDRDDTPDWSEDPLKQVGTELRMYLPDDLVNDLDYEFTGLYREIKHEHGKEIEKNRHFYPLVVDLGLQTVADMDPDELLAELQDREMV